MHGPPLPLLFGIESYLNRRAGRLRNSLICVDPASPAHLVF